MTLLGFGSLGVIRPDVSELSFRAGSVIKGWDVGVATMRKGELARFTIKSDYAYGKSGSPPKIPPDATLIFEIELFDWKGNISGLQTGGGVRKERSGQ